MIGALQVAKTGLSAQDTQLQLISNNLANVSTVGYKKERAVFEDLLYQTVRQPGAQSADDSQLPSGLQLGNGVRVVGTQKLFESGDLEVTDESFDVAINGQWFFPGADAQRRDRLQPQRGVSSGQREPAGDRRGLSAGPGDHPAG